MPTRATPPGRPDAVVFDLGGVLIDWNPRYLYRRLIPDEVEMERFLRDVANPAWNLEHDRGRPFAAGVALLAREHPDQAELIAAFHERWDEMLAGPIDGTVAVLAELHAGGVRLLAMTNWSAETFPFARQRFGFLGWFEHVLVSGDVGLVKPDPMFFQLLVQRYRIEPERTAFVDDWPANVATAAGLGFRAIRFTDPTALRAELVAMDLLRG